MTVVKLDMVNDLVLANGFGLGLTIPIFDIEGVVLVISINSRTRRINNVNIL